jgi:hypothetical protein
MMKRNEPHVQKVHVDQRIVLGPLLKDYCSIPQESNAADIQPGSLDSNSSSILDSTGDLQSYHRTFAKMFVSIVVRFQHE